MSSKLEAKEAAVATPRRSRIWDHLAYCTPQFALMFAFSMPIALLGALADDPRLGLDNSSINSALAVGSMMRAVGKGVNGITVDIVGVKPFLTVVLLGPSLCAIALSFVQGQTGLIAVLGLLAYCNTGGWLCGCKIIESRFTKEEWGGCFSFLATCSRSGTMAARIGLGGLLAFMSWQAITLTSAPLLFGAWVFVTQVLLQPKTPTAPAAPTGHLVVNPQDPDALDRSGQDRPHQRSHGGGGGGGGGSGGRDADGSPSTGPSRKERIKRMVFNREFQLHSAVVMCASCFMGFENMCPLMLKDLTDLSNAEIGVFAVVFPAGVLCGVLTTPQIYARLATPLHKLYMELALQGLATCSILCLIWFSSMATQEPGSVPSICFLICLGTAAFGLALNYYIKPGIVCLDFGEDCATASSMMDGVGQAATVVFQLIASSLFRTGGTWAQVLSAAIFLLLTMSICTVLQFLDHHHGSAIPLRLTKSHFDSVMHCFSNQRRLGLWAALVLVLVVAKAVYTSLEVVEP